MTRSLFERAVRPLLEIAQIAVETGSPAVGAGEETPTAGDLGTPAPSSVDPLDRTEARADPRIARASTPTT